MTWFRVFTAVLAALVVFFVGMSVLAILASRGLSGNESEPEIVHVETVAPGTTR